jgi:hypothetical protein
MEIIIAAIVGFVAGALVFRNNAIRAEKLLAQTQEALVKLKK